MAQNLKRQAGRKTAIYETNNGVDSIVCAFLAHQAPGKKLTALFIDDKLMREKEARLAFNT